MTFLNLVVVSIQKTMAKVITDATRGRTSAAITTKKKKDFISKSLIVLRTLNSSLAVRHSTKLQKRKRVRIKSVLLNTHERFMLRWTRLSQFLELTRQDYWVLRFTQPHSPAILVPAIL